MSPQKRNEGLATDTDPVYTNSTTEVVFNIEVPVKMCLKVGTFIVSLSLQSR